MREVYVPLGFDEIVIPERRRAADPKTVKALADSIDKIGLQHPISIRKHTDQYVLVAGLHRLEACKKLGHNGIMCAIRSFTNAETRMWEISENLHRAELTTQERVEQIAEWVKLCERERKKEVSGQVGQKPQGGRPEGGIAAASRQLGLDRKEVERAVKIASMTPEAKEVAREVGIDNNQSKLLQVAREEPAKQVEAVYKAVQPAKKYSGLPKLDPDQDELGTSITIEYIRPLAANVAEKYAVPADLMHIVNCVSRKRRDEFVQVVDDLQRFFTLLKEALTPPPLSVVPFPSAGTLHKPKPGAA
jgi:ParB family chromosome partitioning protein